MDLGETIEGLRAELKRVEAAIASLESIAVGGETRAPRSRRGRKSMGEAERRDVSERMKRYWASRRAGAVRRAAAG